MAAKAQGVRHAVIVGCMSLMACGPPPSVRYVIFLGRTLNASTGAPLPEVQLTLHSGEPDAPSCSRIEATRGDPDGTRRIFRTRSKDDGRYRVVEYYEGPLVVLCVSHPGYRTLRIVRTDGEVRDLHMVPLDADAPPPP